MITYEAQSPRDFTLLGFAGGVIVGGSAALLVMPLIGVSWSASLAVSFVAAVFGGVLSVRYGAAAFGSFWRAVLRVLALLPPGA